MTLNRESGEGRDGFRMPDDEHRVAINRQPESHLPGLFVMGHADRTVRDDKWHVRLIEDHAHLRRSRSELSLPDFVARHHAKTVQMGVVFAR